MSKDEKDMDIPSIRERRKEWPEPNRKGHSKRRKHHGLYRVSEHKSLHWEGSYFQVIEVRLLRKRIAGAPSWQRIDETHGPEEGVPWEDARLLMKDLERSNKVLV